MTEDMKEKLMAIGLTKQQASSATAEAVVNFLMNADEKTLIQEARLQVKEMSDIVISLRKEYLILKEKVETVAGALLAIVEAQEEHGVFTDEKTKNAVALYAALLNMNERAGAKGEASVNNAGYVTYAYLGGQVRRDIHYDKSRDYDD